MLVHVPVVVEVRPADLGIAFEMGSLGSMDLNHDVNAGHDML